MTNLGLTKEYIQRKARIELASHDFFRYCNLTAPDFYKADRQYLIDLAKDLQDFYKNDEDDVLIINIGPRHGKSRTAGKFVEWVLGNNKNKKIMTGSYNETLSTTFYKSVRNAISEVKADPNIVVFNDIFKETRIRRGDGAMNLWGLEGGHQNYLATSPGGTATGFGADIIIVDDLIKNAEEANNARVLDMHWDWFTNTMLSRLETGGKIILIMTRWHSKDLAGRALKELPELGFKVRHVNLKTHLGNGVMLCDDVLTYEEYVRKTKAMSPEIASANYQQEPIDLKGKLYNLGFKEYGDKVTFKRIESYTDTADTGSDYLATYIYGVTMSDEAYILDVIYTKDSMDVTEPLLAQKLVEHDVNLAWVESNNGGRGYARAVEKILKEEYQWNKTTIKWFHQSQNKVARILTASTWVQEHVYFPEGWRHRWPELFNSLDEYQREGKNAHDDAQDAITGIHDVITKPPGLRVLKPQERIRKRRR